MQNEYLKAIGIWMNLFSEAIYNGKPYSVSPNGKDFLLKGDENTLYGFVYNLGGRGGEHVVVNLIGGLERDFIINDDIKVKEAFWMDDGERLEFTQDGEKLTIACTGYPYGKHYCVRVLKIKI